MNKYTKTIDATDALVTDLHSDRIAVGMFAARREDACIAALRALRVTLEEVRVKNVAGEAGADDYFKEFCGAIRQLAGEQLYFGRIADQAIGRSTGVSTQDPNDKIVQSW